MAELIYYKDWRGNFGDDLNPEFFRCLCPRYSEIPKKQLIGIGTLLNHSRGVVSDSVVFGSGWGQGSPVVIDFNTTKVLGVRGPLTAQSIGLDGSRAVIGDPALLLPKIPSLNSGVSPVPGSIVVGLHHRTAEYWDFSKADSDEFFFLDPAKHSVREYIAIIREAKLVLAESMHSAITATAYDIPFSRIQFFHRTDSVKWRDFFLSVGANDDQPIATIGLPESFSIAARLAAVKRSRVLQQLGGGWTTCFPRDKSSQVLEELGRVVKNSPFLQVSRKGVTCLQERCEDAVARLNDLAHG